MMPSFPTISKYDKRDNIVSNSTKMTNSQQSDALAGRKRRLEDDVSMKGKLNAKFGGDDYSKFNFRFDSQK